MHLTLIILASLLLYPGSSLLAKDSARYDLSYYSTTDLAQAHARRSAIVAALGPELGARLRVVRSDSGFAVVYRRRGNAEGARNAAANHSRILTARGMGAASVVAAKDWVEVAKGAKLPAPAAQPASPPPPPQAPQPQSEAKAPATETALIDSNQRQWLESMIEARIKSLRRDGHLAADERTAWSVYDFTTGEKLVEINADIKLQAASLIKPFVVLAYLHQVDQGKLKYDDLARRHMVRMIQHSDNRSTNWALKRLGGPAATSRILKASYGRILKGLELVEAIPRGGRTYRNKASAADYSRFLLALWKDELPRSDEIKRLMALPKRDRISTNTEVPEDNEVLSKTGSTRHLCGDMGLILARSPDGTEYPYALIGIIEKKSAARNYLRWLRSRGNIIREVSSLIYRTLGERHGFAPTRLAAR